uniref:Uncharacterized protein n=1 Tax=Timema poppense TaxID=170557 RepID=A0A7R9HCY7_TIMPO|nr:unnamed protein product [Timema poppensis]
MRILAQRAVRHGDEKTNYGRNQHLLSQVTARRGNPSSNPGHVVRESAPSFAWRESGKPPDRDSNLTLLGLVYCETSTLDHAVTEAVLSMVMLARKLTTPVYIASYYGVIIVAYHRKKHFLPGYVLVFLSAEEETFPPGSVLVSLSAEKKTFPPGSVLVSLSAEEETFPPGYVLVSLSAEEETFPPGYVLVSLSVEEETFHPGYVLVSLSAEEETFPPGPVLVSLSAEEERNLSSRICLSFYNLVANPVSLLVGTFVCLPYRFPLACVEFLCIKILEIGRDATCPTPGDDVVRRSTGICARLGHGYIHVGCLYIPAAFSMYMWQSVLELQHELALEEDTPPFTAGGPDDHERAELLDLRRRRGRSLADEVENRHRYLDVSHISRSWTDDDELAFGPQPKTTEVTRTRSLDSLLVRLHSDWDMIDSLIGRRRGQEFGGPYYNLKEKAMRFLRLTTSDVERARSRVKNRTPPPVRKRPSGTKDPPPSTLIVTTPRTRDFAAQVSTVSKKWLDRQVESVTVGQERRHAGV